MKAKFAVTLLGAVLIVCLGCIPAAAHDPLKPDETFTTARLKQVNCGIQSLAHLLKLEGNISASSMIHGMLPSSQLGSSLRDLIELSQANGIDLKAYEKGTSSIDAIPVPAIVYLKPEKTASTGHFVVLEKVRGNQVLLYDAQQSCRFSLTKGELYQRWRGIFLGTPDKATMLFQLMADQRTKLLYGGYDGTAQAKSGDGNLGGDPDDPCEGAPKWFVNPLNFNLVVADIPLWYKPALGPSISFRITYNSQATATGSEPFGSKWQFFYGGYIYEDAATGDVTVVMGDGRLDVFFPDGSGGYLLPYSKYNRLTKIAANHFEVRTPLDEVSVYQIPAGSGLTKPYLVEMRNARGQSVTIGYNASGELATITDADGQVTSLTYTNGKVTRATDPFGRYADFEYTGDFLTRITDMGGIWAALDYDQDANLTSIENDRGTTEFLIEGGGRAYPYYPPPGYPAIGAHHRITITDPLGNKEEYFYNGVIGYGWHVSPRDYVEYVDEAINNSSGLVPKTTYYYEDTSRGPREEIATVIYPEGRQVTTAHDYDTGRILSVSDSYGNTTEYTYNDMGRVTSVTPEIGAVTTLVYDPANNVDLVQINRYGLGPVLMTYNAYHEVTTVTDMVGKQIDPIVYNGDGQVISITQVHDDHNILTHFSYHPAGQPGANRLAQVTRAGQTVSAYTYDNIGRVETATDAAGIILTYSYDNLNHITQVLYPDSKAIQYVYSSCCPRLVDSITDSGGRITTFEYDALERLVTTINPEGGKLTYEYDPNGNLTGFVNPNRNLTAFEYDFENRLTKRIWTDGRAIQVFYDKNGRMIRRTDPRGIRSDYVYDGNGNLLSQYYSDDTPWVTYEYDDYNRLTAATDGLGATSYTYYDDSSLQSVDGPWGNDTLTYTYDKLGRTVGVNPQLGRALSYAYDDLNRVTSVQTDTRAFSYAYTGADPRVQSLTGPEGGQATYQYVDPLKRLTATINTDSSSQSISRFDYAYADAQHPDQISSETITDGPALNFSSDQVTTYDHNVVEQMTTDSNQGTLEYDYAGNLTQGYTPNGQPFSATYDAVNRLDSIEYTDGGTTYKAEFVYSANSFLGQIKKYENSVLVNDIRIVRDGFLALQERDATNQVTREYAWGANMGGGIGGLLNMRQGGMDHTYYYDGKGNVSAVLDTSESLAAAYRYDSFGKVMTQAGTLDQPFQFSTKRLMADVGLNYYGYRFYAPSIGKWLTRDPLREAGGINLYGFVGNNPITLVDPFGLDMITSNRNDAVEQATGVDLDEMRKNHLELALILSSFFPMGPSPFGVFTCNPIKPRFKKGQKQTPNPPKNKPKVNRSQRVDNATDQATDIMNQQDLNKKRDRPHHIENTNKSQQNESYNWSRENY